MRVRVRHRVRAMAREEIGADGKRAGGEGGGGGGLRHASDAGECMRLYAYACVRIVRAR